MTAGNINRRSWATLLGWMLVSFSPAGHAADPTPSQIDAVRNKVAQFWYLDPNATSTKHVVVDVRATLSPDGSVLSAEVVDKTCAANDANYREFAQAAVRAVIKCSPLPMPAGQYDMWKVTNFHFDATGMQ